MAAACYQAFGRIVLWIIPPEYQSARHLWLPARRITPVFVMFEIFTFFVQVIGASILAGGKDTNKTNLGKNIINVGLFLQVICFGFFVIASLRFGFVLRTKLKGLALPNDTNWPIFLVMVNIASIHILVRTVYRMIVYFIVPATPSPPMRAFSTSLTPSQLPLLCWDT